MKIEPTLIGNPAPWFEARTLANTEHGLGVMAGRWIVLCFVNNLSSPFVMRALADLIARMGLTFNDDKMVFYAVLTAPPLPEIANQFAQASHRGLGFFTDYDGKISQQYDAKDKPKLIVLDPLLRFEKIFSLHENTSSDEICSYLKNLPSIDDFAGVPLTAPALIIPHVFEPDFCQYLIDLHQKNGGIDSGFLHDRDGKTMTVVDHKMKQRSDFVITEPEVRDAIRDRVARRVAPLMERFFQYKPTRMDRYLVSCYDTETGGHFSRHRDNVNLGARHRRFAASFNLNADYEGCGLVFPEFGRHVYKAPCGGGIVFSTGALHQVLPITRGKRYAFVPFFYGEQEAQERLQNNINLHEGEGLYSGENDKLYGPAS